MGRGCGKFASIDKAKDAYVLHAFQKKRSGGWAGNQTALGYFMRRLTLRGSRCSSPCRWARGPVWLEK